MTSIYVGRIRVFIFPLLALTANQMARLRKAVQKCGAVSVVHLDDTAGDDVRLRLIPRMDSLRYESFDSLILLCSLQ